MLAEPLYFIFKTPQQMQEAARMAAQSLIQKAIAMPYRADARKFTYIGRHADESVAVAIIGYPGRSLFSVSDIDERQEEILASIRETCATAAHRGKELTGRTWREQLRDNSKIIYHFPKREAGEAIENLKELLDEMGFHLVILEGHIRTHYQVAMNGEEVGKFKTRFNGLTAELRLNMVYDTPSFLGEDNERTRHKQWLLSSVEQVAEEFKGIRQQRDGLGL